MRQIGEELGRMDGELEAPRARLRQTEAEAVRLQGERDMAKRSLDPGQMMTLFYGVDGHLQRI